MAPTPVLCRQLLNVLAHTAAHVVWIVAVTPSVTAKGCAVLQIEPAHFAAGGHQEGRRHHIPHFINHLYMGSHAHMAQKSAFTHPILPFTSYDTKDCPQPACHSWQRCCGGCCITHLMFGQQQLGCWLPTAYHIHTCFRDEDVCTRT